MWCTDVQSENTLYKKYHKIKHVRNYVIFILLHLEPGSSSQSWEIVGEIEKEGKKGRCVHAVKLAQSACVYMCVLSHCMSAIGNILIKQLNVWQRLRLAIIKEDSFSLIH